MKTGNKYRFFVIMGFILLIVMLFYLTSGSATGEYISFQGEKSVETMIGANKDEAEIVESSITHIYMIGGVGRVIKKNSDIIVPVNGDIPSNCDYYFTYSSTNEIPIIMGWISKYNTAVDAHNAAEPENSTNMWSKIQIVTQVQSASILETLLPYISILIILVISFILIKSIMGANSKSMSFGKTKATVAQNVKTRFSDVAGIDEEKEEVQEIVEFLKDPQKFTEIGAKIPKGILLVGLPGTGKTLLAKAIAGESKVPFFSISGSDFVEMFVGVGASRVRDLFDHAKKSAPCIVFIDEIDAVGRQRGAGLGGGNDEREQTLNQLLVQMDGFEGNEGIIVIAATNRSDVLDPALLRPGRFDRQIYINPPDVKGRELIAKVHAKNKPIDESVDFKTVAKLTSGFTGADIENLLNEAAILTARSGRKKITMVDITEGINKVLMGPQKKSRIITENDKKITACHEAGHAIIGKKLSHCDVVQEVSIIPRGMAAGYTISRPDNDESHMSYSKLIDNITMLLGGRVAEEALIKDISTGAQNDIERATKLARKMVTEWGMSKKLGTVNLGSTSEVFIGRDYQTQLNYSEQTSATIDEEVRGIIESCYEKARKIILDNLKPINTMIELLLERETIYYEEIEMVIKGKSKEEILKHIQEQEKENKNKYERERAEADLEKARKEQAIRLKTAEALKNANVISIEEYQKVKADANRIIEEAQAKASEIASKTLNKKSDASEKSNDNENGDKKDFDKEKPIEKEALSLSKDDLKPRQNASKTKNNSNNSKKGKE